MEMPEVQLIRIGAAQVADYMVASERLKRSILTSIKFDEGFGGPYYIHARRVIQEFHAHDQDVEWLHEAASEMRADAESAETDHATRCLNDNADAVDAYAINFSEPRLQLQANPRGKFRHGDVIVTGQPDLVGRVGRRFAVIRLHFSGQSIDEQKATALGRIQYLCLESRIPDLKPKHVQIQDVREGVTYAVPSNSVTRFTAELKATLENIQAIWASLGRPTSPAGAN
jgi:hypothetical protein